jgi:hypothetical protein
VPRRVECGAQRDPARGQGAGLVRDQHIEVFEVFDAHQALDQDLALGQPPRPGGQAGAHHGRQQLRGDPDGDREGEQQRIEQRARQQ